MDSVSTWLAQAVPLAALRRLRGRADVEAEMEDMRTEERAERAAGHLSVLNLFTFRSLRWQLISVIVLMAGQQLSGINAVRAPSTVHRGADARVGSAPRVRLCGKGTSGP